MGGWWWCACVWWMLSSAREERCCLLLDYQTDSKVSVLIRGVGYLSRELGFLAENWSRYGHGEDEELAVDAKAGLTDECRRFLGRMI